MLLLGVLTANAQVIHNDLDDVTVSGELPSVGLDFDGDGVPDFDLQFLSGSVSGVDVQAVGISAINHGVGVQGRTEDIFGSEVPLADALGQNDPIASVSIDSAAFCIRVDLGVLGKPQFGDEAWREGGAYLGFAFERPGGDGGPTLHFGWARLQASDGCGSVTLMEFAYEMQPNTPILAGDTGTQPLPVELVSFEAQASGTDVLLQWATASETDNAGFEVQHKTGGAYRTLAFLEGAGTTSEAQHYIYRLAELSPGTHRFRLKQLDFDGTFTFSPEVEVQVEVPDVYLLSAVYPNPFNPRARFTLSVAKQQRVIVAVYDALGRRVALLHSGTLAAGETHAFELEGSSWPSGLYLIQVQGEAFAETHTVTLVR